MRSAVCVLTLLSLLPSPASPTASRAATRTPAGEPPPIYRQLRAAALRTAGHVHDAELAIDRASFRFDDGELYLAEPVAGMPTGAVFLGRGRFRLTAPDQVGRQQIDKFLKRDDVDLEFKSVVMRFSDETADRLRRLTGEPAHADPGRATKVWRQRHEQALQQRLLDLDARVAMDLWERRAGTRDVSEAYFYAAIDAKGGLSFEIDPFNREEVRLYRTHGLNRPWDNWAAFHRAADYGGTVLSQRARVLLPTHESWQPAAEVPDVAVDVAIDNGGEIRSSTELLIRPLRPSATLRLSISPILQVQQVYWAPVAAGQAWPGADWASIRTGPADQPHELSGLPVPFVQTHEGRGLEEDRWEPRITVFLPRVLQPGQQVVVSVKAEGKLLEQLPNRDFFQRDTQNWYPQHLHARRSRFHTVFRTSRKRRVATGGALQQQQERDGIRIEQYLVARPAVGMSFQYGDLHPKTYSPEGHPPITVFSSPHVTGFSPGNRDKVLRDITSAARLYSEYFGPVPYDSLVLAEVPGFSGQSFPGFVLLSFSTFGGMHTGEAELFRTHELAHQWWGNAVTWDTYHDQWMSEGFAQYAAALHTLLALEDEDQFLKMMRAWGKDVMAKIDIGQRFGMRFFGHTPGVLRKSDGPETGPIWLGYRLASDKTPHDYRLQVYEKGAYVLHMLRMMLLDWSSNDDSRFRELLRSFQAAHAGGHCSTEQFLQAVSEAFGEPMDWFFDQWVYGTDVPTYRPELKAHSGPGGWRLQGRIRQSDVPDRFHMPVPIRIRYRDGSTEVLSVLVNAPEVPVDLPLRAKPAHIEFNPMYAVLADVR